MIVNNTVVDSLTLESGLVSADYQLAVDSNDVVSVEFVEGGFDNHHSYEVLYNNQLWVPDSTYDGPESTFGMVNCPNDNICGAYTLQLQNYYPSTSRPSIHVVIDGVESEIIEWPGDFVEVYTHSFIVRAGNVIDLLVDTSNGLDQGLSNYRYRLLDLVENYEAIDYLNIAYDSLGGNRYGIRGCEVLSTFAAAATKHRVELYPNPANEYVQFATDVALQQVVFRNLLGSAVLTQRNGNTTVNVSALKSPSLS